MLFAFIICFVLSIILFTIAAETYGKVSETTMGLGYIFLLSTIVFIAIVICNAYKEEYTYTVHSSKELVITDSENHIEKTINELVIVDDNDRIYIIYLNAENLSKYKVDDKTIKISLNDIDKFKQIELNNGG